MTGIVRTTPLPSSAAYDHFLKCGAKLDPPVRPGLKDFSVVASAPYDSHLLIKEAFIVAREKPDLANVQSVPLRFF